MSAERKPIRRPGTARDAVAEGIPAACADELKAVEFFEAQRWGDSPACPRCGDTDVAKMKDKDGARNKRFLWRCHGCKGQYTVRVGTVLEDSRVPLRHWAYAFWAACSGKKGVSALQIQRQTGLSYRSALFLMHRIRFAMAPANEMEPKLGAGGGTVEFDEVYIGGRPRRISRRPDGSVRMGPGWDFSKRKTPVVAGVERGGRVKARVTGNITALTLSTHLLDMVDTSAHLMTDERPAYRKPGKQYASHRSVHHDSGEYVRGDVTTNRIEGFFAGLKRQIKGTHHAVSKKHLHRYVSEVEFKYNTRNMTDGERVAHLMSVCEGRRLSYDAQVGRA